MPWWNAQNHADRRPLLALRALTKAALRAWFEGQGFAEVECAILGASPGNEAHLHAFETMATDPAGGQRTLYLHTSPEFAAKKLLAAGEERIFEFARVFRNREQGPLHAPEFTMLEWYRKDAPVTAVMDDAVTLVRMAAKHAGATMLRYRDRGCDPFADAEPLSVVDAFRIHAGIEIMDTLASDGVADGGRDMLATRARRAGLAITNA
ncbi:MAG: amino acid--tRNA ligase-related protein, partial [Hyphomicrobiales bacterium]